MSSKVVVTGAGGRLGGMIAQRLKDEGRLMAGVDMQASSLVTHVMDLSKGGSDELKKVFEGAETIVHAAAVPGPSVTSPDGSRDAGEELMRRGTIGLESLSPSEVLSRNVSSTMNVFEAASAAGARRVVFSSSAFAMGWSHDSSAFVPSKLPLREEDGPLPFETYGLSKAVGEETAKMFARATGLEFVSLRFTNVVKREAYGNLPWTYDEKAPVAMWAWCHEDDVIDAHLRAIDSVAATNKTYLIAAPSTRFEEDTRDLAARHFGLSYSEPPGNASIFDSSMAQLDLDWHPRCWTQGSQSARKALRDPDLQSFPVGGFELESGEKMPPQSFLTFKLYGSEREDLPLVVHPTSYGACHVDLEYQVGPGKLLDTNKCRVAMCNMFGNGASCSPSNVGSAGYPRKPITIKDNVRMQRAALNHLIKNKISVYGYSMGAMQAWEWARTFPEDVDRIVAVCGSTGCTDYNAVFLNSLRQVLQRPDPLPLVAAIYAGWGVGYDLYRDSSYGRASVEEFVEKDYVPGFADDDPQDLLAMLETWRAAKPFESRVLQQIRARCLVLPCHSDAYFRIDHIEQNEIKHVPDATLHTIMSPYGHRAGNPSRRPELDAEARYLQDKVQAFLFS